MTTFVERTAPESTATTRWLPAAALVFCCGWGGNQFSPLLIMYTSAGYSAVLVDALLGAYVLGLIPGLLCAGRLADRLGRRPVMVTGAALSLLASVLLALGPLGPGWIAAGRFITGLGVACAMAAGCTWVKELSDARPGAAPDLGTRRAALWLTLGFGIGPGVAGVLAQWGPAPMVLPYLVHAALTATVLPFAFRSRETRCAQRVHAPVVAYRHPRFRRVILPMAPWVFGSLGVAYAIMPQLVSAQLGSLSLAFATLLTVCAIGAGVGIQPLAKRLDRAGSARAVLVGLSVVCLGLGASALAAALRSPWLALACAAVLGAAYGITVVSGLLELNRLARPDEIAQLTGLYYALAYLGFLLPTALAALSTVASYTVLLLALVVIAAAGLLVVARHSRRHLPALGSAG